MDTSSSIDLLHGENSLADDRLRGAKAIGNFLGEPDKRVYYLAARAIYPIGKEGAALIASKAALRARHEQLTQPHASRPSASSGPAARGMAIAVPTQPQRLSDRRPPEPSPRRRRPSRRTGGLSYA
jgi:hypothetical protein